MNRYTRVSTQSSFNPMSLDQVMAVPLAKQNEFEAQQSKLDEYGLFDLNRLDVDDASAREFVNQYTQDIDKIADELSTFGNSTSVSTKARELKSRRDKYMNQSGDGYKIQDAYKRYNENVANINKQYAAGNITAQDAEKAKQYAKKRYTGYKDGEYQEFTPSKTVNVRDIANEFAASVPVSQIASGQGLKKVPGFPRMYQYTDSSRKGRRKYGTDANDMVTAEQIVAQETKEYLENNKNLQSYYSDQKLYDENFDANESIQAASEAAQRIYGREDKSSRTNYGILPQSNSSKSNSEEVEIKPTYVTDEAIEPIAPTVSANYEKIKENNQKLKDLNPKAPNYKKTRDMIIRDNRERYNIDRQANVIASKDPRVIELQKEKQKQISHIDFTYESLKKELELINDNGDALYNLERMYKGNYPKDSLDTSPEALAANEARKRFTNNADLNSKISQFNADINNMKAFEKNTIMPVIDEIKNKHIEQQGRQRTVFHTIDSNTDKNNFLGNVKGLFNNIDIDFQNVDIFKGNDELSNINSTGKNSEIFTQLKDIFTTGNLSSAKFSTDGNGAYIQVTAEPQDDVEFDGSTPLFSDDIEIGKGQTVTAQIPLITYSGNNIPRLNRLGVGLINSSELDPSVKVALNKSIMTSSMSATSNYDRLGETSQHKSFLGKNLSNRLGLKENESVDYYQPLGANQPMQMYKIKTNDKGELEYKKPIVLKDVLDIEKIKNSDEPSGDMFQNKLMNNYIKYARTNTIQDLINLQIPELASELEKYADKNTPIISLFENLNNIDKIGEIPVEEEPTDEVADSFADLIKYLPVMLINKNDIVDFKMYLK